MAEAMEAHGWELVPFGAAADCTIINTCCVTARAQADSRRWIYRARRANPDAIILAVGCYPQIAPEEVIALGADGVAGNQEKEAIPAIVEERQQDRGGVIKVGAIKEAARPPDLRVHGFRNHTRAFLKVQDGCDAQCSYCIVPLARGRSRSVPVADVIASLKELSAAGYQEVVLTGIHLGMYGQDLTPRTSLLDLLRRIEEADTPARIRLSSLEPQEATPELIKLAASSQKFCPHFHLPLQSGCDEVLRRMNRPYTGLFFRDLVQQIVDLMPDAAIGCDVIAGFPGEDEQAFDMTYDLLKSLPISYLHCFPFSPRPGTKAAGLDSRVGEPEKRERVQRLRKLGMEKRQAFYSRYLNQTLSLLIEHRREDGQLRGLSRNYLFCLIEGGDELMGNEVQAVMLDVKKGRGVGKIVT
ncbi:MAG: tRNA (N(6)-L-threonylcarbamoyladenosine(37)-C(2))-methylthiotransferase MtaB [Deltaproteobacteria bacterium RBG_16_54_11]|nr:MAG: tRNA (N(6)-L-threonylcarbamoyladenosine(37)-C(2))-methylthiotransferase MtaB [Deltaproteobacteria bacterium RBG_16_54_11]